jgi:hypothetical protein
MSEWMELTWDDAMKRGYEALSSGEALYEEIDAEQGRSNIDIKAGPAGGLRPPSGPAATRRSPGRRPYPPPPWHR